MQVMIFAAAHFWSAAIHHRFVAVSLSVLACCFKVAKNRRTLKFPDFPVRIEFVSGFGG
jgi:hypothetical protein